MAIEQIIQAVIAASPAKRARIAAVLNGTDTNNKTPDKRDTRLITISGAAKMLALGRNTVYRLIKQKRLDYVMLTGVPRVTWQSINEFLDGQRPENAVTSEMINESKARYAARRTEYKTTNDK